MSDVLYKIKQLSKSREHEAFLDTLFGNHSRRVIKGAISVVLFGAGDVGRDLCEVLQLHGVQPKCFCDNNTSNVGSSYHGVPVISFDELKAKHRDHLIIVASCKFGSEIRQQLLGHSFPADNLISVESIRHPEFLRYYRHCPYYTNNPCHALSMQDLQIHEEELSRTYNLLADQKSKDIFIARLSLFTSRIDFLSFSNYLARYSEINEQERDTFPFYVSPEDYGYFNKRLLKKTQESL